ncbi:MAG: rhomboid family intramembrane serine protease, partial [Aquabacterium sp.]|nr:rhomboid family intramembrane serine protease [Aquabacterium sp.]
MPPLPPITQALLLINVALFCLDLAFGHLLSQFMALWPLQSGYFMPWQVVTYAFMHGSMGHIFFNMMGLWMFGSELERIWGPRRYLQFLLASVLTAAACQLLISMLGGGNNPTVGASGGLFGLLV